MQKRHVVGTFKLLVELMALDATGITGHSARVAGAQRLAAAGVPAWRVQAFGRWGSMAVLKYVREAMLQGDGLTPGLEYADRSKSVNGKSTLASSLRNRSPGLNLFKSVDTHTQSNHRSIVVPSRTRQVRSSGQGREKIDTLKVIT
jgi:hypothetical protein